VAQGLGREIDRLTEPKLVCVQRCLPELYLTTPTLAPKPLFFFQSEYSNEFTAGGKKLDISRGRVAAAACPSETGIMYFIQILMG
jgi:hypothetical protein